MIAFCETNQQRMYIYNEKTFKCEALFCVCMCVYLGNKKNLKWSEQRQR